MKTVAVSSPPGAATVFLQEDKMKVNIENTILKKHLGEMKAGEVFYNNSDKCYYLVVGAVKNPPGIEAPEMKVFNLYTHVLGSWFHPDLASIEREVFVPTITLSR